MKRVGPVLHRETEIEAVLRSLPQWFGVESALLMHVADSATRPTLAVESAGAVVGFLTLARHFPLSWEVHCMAASAALALYLSAGCRFVKHVDRKLTGNERFAVSGDVVQWVAGAA